jgi:large subunit ribosomal protein L4
MLVDVFNMEGEKVEQVELPDTIFGAPIRIDLMHQALVRQNTNARLGTHDTKTRNEVAGGGRKPWKQKGTGRARQGSTRAAQWKGGGRIHTPHPVEYRLSMPRKMRRAALCSALSVKAAESSIVVVKSLDLAEPKTKVMAKVLNSLVGDASALVILPKKEEYQNVIASSANLPSTKTLLAGYLNIRDLLKFEKLVLPVAALDAISEHLG